MMKSRILPLVLLLGLLAGCDAARAPRQVSITQAGEGPQAWIDAPLDGMQIPLAPYEFVAHGTDESGIRQLEWELNGSQLAATPAEGSGKLATFRYIWSPPAPGEYTLTVRAQNGAGGWSGPDTVTFTVGEATPTPVEVTITPTPSETHTLVITDTPTPTATATATATQTSTPTLIPADQAFSPGLSTGVFYYGSCQPNSVEVTVQLASTQNVKHVELFLRLLDQESGDSTKWDSYAVMSDRGNGLYRTVVKAATVPGAERFSQATALYQFIVIGTNGKVLARSDSYNDLSLNGCGFFILPGLTLQPILIPSKTPIIIK
jgi:hypothetical protein